MTSSAEPRRPPPLSSDGRGLYQKQRLREFLKYFIAAWESTGHQVSDIDEHVQDGYEPEKAVLSSDPILNALAQLAAHRLACDRAFISIIDDNHQFIIAEATRSISLYDGSIHAPGEGICIGARPLDFVAGVCATTFQQFLTDGPCLVTPNCYADTSRYIINNFLLEEEYKDRPYVTGFPFFRYYAEVPIKVASGAVIGTLSVIDNKPGNGLSEDRYLALAEIAKTIMLHLEMVKAEQDHKQASTLLSGLNTFLMDDSPKETASYAAPQSNHLSQTSIAPPSSGASPSDPPKGATVTTIGEIESKRPNKFDVSWKDDVSFSVSPSSESSSTTRTLPFRDKPGIAGSNHQSHESAETHTADLEDQVGPPTAIENHYSPDDSRNREVRSLTMSEEVRARFSRASTILRTAMDLDGVVFLDAGLSESSASFKWSEPSHETSLPNGVDGNEPSKRPSIEVSGGVSTGKNISECLGYSVKKSPNAADGPTNILDLSISEEVLQSLLHCYPNGTILDFNRDFSPTEGDRSRSQRKGSSQYENGMMQRIRLLSRKEIDQALKIAFPSVRSAVFVPLWSPHKERWLSGGLGWTTKEKRVLQKDDLAYFSVFGNSIMAELTRLHLLASDRAKTGFISSISHELRSPLHGILGTAELLREAIIEGEHQQMIGMIESCGHTLLDTVDHILDYAKISMKITATDDQRRASLSDDNDLIDPSMQGKVSLLDLGVVMEDTVEAVVAGHGYRSNGLSRILDNDITVVVDVDHAPSWLVETESAAWRRIILNLVGNALKYTEKGVVEIMLHMKDKENHERKSPSERLISLKVRDTGRGMSTEFMQNDLFTPFKQENELSVGTGLGLSIVQNIVQDLRGTVQVRSEIGIGTEVVVLVPAKVALPVAPSEAAIQESTTMEFVGPDFASDISDRPRTGEDLKSTSNHALTEALKNYARNWLGMKVLVSEQISKSADIVVVGSENLHRLLSKDSVQSGAAISEEPPSVIVPAGMSVLVICSTQETPGSYSAVKSKRIQYLAQPIGPRKMELAVKAALAADRTTELFVPMAAVRSTPPHPPKLRDEHWQSGASVRSMSEPPPVPASVRLDLERPACNLLIVDDNTINIKLLSTFAKKLNCAYSTASNGQEAVDIYASVFTGAANTSDAGTKTSSDEPPSRNHLPVSAHGPSPIVPPSGPKPFTYVLMDISMPIMSGFEATRAIRELEVTHSLPHVPIIALTGLGSMEAQEEAMISGMDVFLTKPVSMKKIRALVEGGLDALRKA